jgi:predicted amidohydrolase
MATLAAAQIISRPGDVEGNLAEHVRLSEMAAGAGAGLLVFPELSLTGYELELADELAFSETDSRLEPLQALARARDITLVVGAPLRVGARLHIAAFIVSPARAPSVYTKQHLGAFSADVNPGGPVPPPEPSIFEPGAHDPLLQVESHTAAVAICADTGRPAHAQAAADRHADLYCASMFFTPTEVAQEHARLQGYATRHRMTVIASNYGGRTGRLPAGGHSAIWSNQGSLLCCLEHAGSGVALAERTDAGWRGRALS